jgi:hypothetical protein
MRRIDFSLSHAMVSLMYSNTTRQVPQRFFYLFSSRYLNGVRRTQTVTFVAERKQQGFTPTAIAEAIVDEAVRCNIPRVCERCDNCRS